MTADAAETFCSYIKHPAIRARAILLLTNGTYIVCPTCGNLADAVNGCTPCNDAYWDAQAAAHEEMMANAEASTGCDAYAIY